MQNLREPQSPMPSANSAAGEPIAITIQMPPERHDYVSDGISALVGFGGAVIGAYVAYKLGQRAASEARIAAASDREKALCQALVLKLNVIYHAQKTFADNIASARERLRVRESERADQPLAEGGFGEPRINEEIKPLANLPPRSNITPDEISAAASVTGGEAFPHLMVLGESHDSTIDLWIHYAARRAVFMELADQWQKYEGGYLIYSWDRPEYEKLSPILDELDAAIGSIEKHAVEDRDKAFSALRATVQGMVGRGWYASGAKITSPNGEEITISNSQ